MKEEKILKKLDLIQNQINLLKNKINKPETKKQDNKERNDRLRQNALAVRYVSALVTRGVPQKKAMRLCAFKLKIDISKVNDLFMMYQNDQKYIDRRVNWLICEKLHKKGFPAKKIAEICDFSEKYVFKVLKKIIEN